MRYERAGVRPPSEGEALVQSEACWIPAGHTVEVAGRRIDGGSLRFWEVLGSLKMSILAWRAIQVTADGKERSLLEQLRADLARELATQVAG